MSDLNTLEVGQQAYIKTGRTYEKTTVIRKTETLIVVRTKNAIGYPIEKKYYIATGGEYGAKSARAGSRGFSFASSTCLVLPSAEVLQKVKLQDARNELNKKKGELEKLLHPDNIYNMPLEKAEKLSAILAQAVKICKGGASNE